MRRLSFPAVILILYVVLAALYSAVVPMFESPDENFHFAYIQRIVHFGDLPYQDPAVRQPWNQEGSQPPLYYLAASLVARFIPADYVPEPLKINPHARVGIGVTAVNNNFFLHTDYDAFPWRGIPLRFHLVRLFSVALGAVTLYGVYRTARLAVPACPGVARLALAFTAFNPMFLFMNGSVNNDSMVTLLAVVSMWLMLAIIQEGFTIRRGALLALALALVSLSKISGLTLYAVYGVLLACLFLKRRLTFRQGIAALAMLAAAFAVLAAWWYVRNLQLYGDLTGLRVMIQIIKPRKNEYTLSVMLNEMQGLRISFWALFGWLNVIGPEWFLWLMDILTGLALVGGIAWVVRELRAQRFEVLLPVGILGLQFAVTFVSLINWTRMTPGTQGRLLLPSIAAIATLMALGWNAVARYLPHPKSLSTWWRGTFQSRPTPPLQLERGLGGEVIAFIPVLVIFAVAVLSPFLTIIPRYAPPPTVARLPDGAVPIEVHFDKINVVGFQVDPAPIRPGQSLQVTVYYEGEPDTRNLSLYLTAYDRTGREVGKIDSYPGRGNLTTSSWKAGRIYADTYPLPIDTTAEAPMQPMIEFGWWDLKTQERLKPVTVEGKSLDALILRGGTVISADPPPQPATAQRAVFSGALRFNGYTLYPANGTLRAGENIQLNLNWEALSRVYEDFTVFVHLETPDGRMIVPGDGQPYYGHYPTSAWAVNQPFEDPHALAVPADTPPGQYRLVVGLYRVGDGSRLPVDSGGDSLVLQTPIIIK
jgi:hypothetical protein